MKFIKQSLILFSLLAVWSCGGNTEKTSTEDDAAKKAAEEKLHQEREARGFHTFEPDFQTLTVSYDGILRGVNMLDAKSAVKLAEEVSHEIDFNGEKSEMPKAELAEETDDKLVYKLKMADREDAVINYGFSEDQLTSINVIVHVPDNVSFEAMENELIQFFTHKFDTPDVFEDRKEVWKVEGDKVHEVDIIEKQEGDKFYVEIDVK